MDNRTRSFHLTFEIEQHLSGDLVQIHRCKRMCLRRHPREPEQILHELLHPLCGGVRPLQVVESLLGETIALRHHQLLREGSDLS